MAGTAGEYKHQQLTDKIIGVFYEGYKELGYGFLESVYEEAFRIALKERGLKFQRPSPLPVWYRGQQISEFRADVLVEELVVVELKAARVLHSSPEAQLLNYLRACAVEPGLLLNFGPRPQVRRLVFTNHRKPNLCHLCSSVAK